MTEHVCFLLEFGQTAEKFHSIKLVRSVNYLEALKWPLKGKDNK